LAFLERLARRLPEIGDDAAVVEPPRGPLLLSADALVEGVHADLSVTTAADFGWKALAVNVSDIAAMGGRPLHALVTVVVPPGRGADLEALYEGLLEASAVFGCPVVGGDLTAGPALTVSVSVTGTVDDGGPGPVRRSGARPGDVLWVTGPLGAAARDLQAGRAGAAHARPRPRLAEGGAARWAGATAMLDLSDGLALDLRRLAGASGVGVVVDEVPVAEGATLEQALGGGDDYELLAACPVDLPGWRRVGRCTADPGERRLAGSPLPAGGWSHSWS
jgi:thiamine-monophosphate kinase